MNLNTQYTLSIPLVYLVYPANCATSCAFSLSKNYYSKVLIECMWICCPFIKKLLNKFYINRRDLLVVTAQILLNALRDGIVSVTDFSLMVFDECHHTNDNHSYNMIMNRYLDIKLQDRERAKTLPMVRHQSFNICYCWLKIQKYIVLNAYTFAVGFIMQYDFNTFIYIIQTFKT